MANFKIVLILTIICACVIVDAQESTFGQNQYYGQSFEEVIVSSDLNVRRKSKENREGKKLLTNVLPAETTARTGPIISRLISSDGGRVVPVPRNRRNALPEYRLNLGSARYLLQSTN